MSRQAATGSTVGAGKGVLAALIVVGTALALLLIVRHDQNSTLVRKKSAINTAMLASTTAWVVERPTPAAPPVV